MFYYDPQGRELLDGLAGLWCSLAGHGRKEITAAVAKQVEELDFAPTFQFAHPNGHRTRRPLVGDGARRASTTSSSATRAPRPPTPRSKSRSHIGARRAKRIAPASSAACAAITARISAACRSAASPTTAKPSARCCGNVDHLPTTYDRAKQAFSKGDPDYGAHFADALEELVMLHGDTIAAVIVEPMAGSTGVLPPPKGYLQTSAPTLRQARPSC